MQSKIRLPMAGNRSINSQVLSRFFLSSLIFLVALVDVSVPQEDQIPKYSQEVGVTVVNLYASVRDSKGRPVYNLKQEDFFLKINGKPQQITNFSADITEPLNIVYLLDVSGSMRMMNKFDVAKNIIKGITAKLGPEDEVALLIFADGVVEMLVEFTKDKQRMITRMDQLKAYGGTALRNAIAYCHRLLIENVGKKGVVLLSDGVDNRSDLTLEQAISRIGQVELPIYTFELIRSKWLEEKPEEKTADELPLRAFAEATGGLYFTMEEASGEQLDKACAKIFEDLKYQYYIGYIPRGEHSSYGKVDLRTKNSKHRVRVRYSVVAGG